MYGEQLRFNKDGRFRILVFTDVHEKSDISGKKRRLKSDDTLLFMNTALDSLKPDLVVLGGDNCTDFDSSGGIEAFYPAFRRITEPMISRGIPFASVLGNHEHDIDEKLLEQVIRAYEECPLSLAHNDNDSEHGRLDYNVTIKAHDSQQDAFNLWFMDSNNLIDLRSRLVYDGVRRDQIEWYEKRAEELRQANSGKPLPAVLFQHIPVQEIYGMFRQPRLFERPVSVRGYDALDRLRFVKNKSCVGYLGEGPNVSFYNDGQFASWKRTGDIVGAFFGHDHLNDFHGMFDGIVMGQSKTGGFNCYTDGCRTGARVVDIYEDAPGDIETYMVRFKQLGLKSSSLGPIMKRINDRQSMAMHSLARKSLSVACVAAGAGAAYMLLKRSGRI